MKTQLINSTAVRRHPILRTFCLLLYFQLAVFGQHAAATVDGTESVSFDNEQALAYSQAAIGKPVGNYSLLTKDEVTVELSSYSGKPLVVSLIYTSCYHICPLLTENLAKVVKIAQDTLGADRFNIITLGFDSAVDTPERMRLFAAERMIDIPNWSFLSANAETVKNFSADLGFIFFASPKGFDHLTQTTIIDSQGRVHRQIYGNTFTAPQLVEPLKELIYGSGSSTPVNLSDLLNNIRLFCTVYDPASGRYLLDYSLLTTVFIGLLCLGAVAFFLVHAWRQNQA